MRKARSRISAPECRLGAVVLSRALSGEADLVVTFLTRELGLLTAVAKNARLSRRRFGGGLLNPGRAAWYDFRIRPGSDLCLVARGENNPGFPLLPEHPVALALGAWAVELVRSLEAPRNPAPRSFNLLVRHLVRLASCRHFQPPALPARRLSLGFTKCYLEAAGFGPSFKACRRCGRQPQREQWAWDPALGAVYCPECRPGALETVPGELIALLGQTETHLDAPPLTAPMMTLAESFLVRMASLAADRNFLSRRILAGLLLETPRPAP
ncbi:MAG: recombination protein O N-terminal domain-containing protein [Deltaproteobacteria bacterium]|jgi:DNA repair protein RecO (recombination protein O)|nr:recombination protein O N-terminal domain-containing protein [Deltaproteobacteria bacterium]